MKLSKRPSLQKSSRPHVQESREIFIISNLQNYYARVKARTQHTTLRLPYITSIINSLMIYGVFIFCGAMFSFFMIKLDGKIFKCDFQQRTIYYWANLNFHATLGRKPFFLRRENYCLIGGKTFFFFLFFFHSTRDVVRGKIKHEDHEAEWRRFEFLRGDSQA